MWMTSEDLSTGPGPLYEPRCPDHVTVVLPDGATLSLTAADAREQCRAGRATFQSEADWQAVDPRGYATAARESEQAAKAAEAAADEQPLVTVALPDGSHVSLSPWDAREMVRAGRATFLSDEDWAAVDHRGFVTALREAARAERAAEAAKRAFPVTLVAPDGQVVTATPLNAVDMLRVGYSDDVRRVWR